MKPFHESIVDVIEKADLPELGLIGKIIMATKIPDGHVQSVLDAWRKKTGNTAASSPVNANLLARMDNDYVFDEGPTADEICEVRGD